jgi:hypothetical protein
MPAFIPDAQHRRHVSLRMPQREICGLILNPRTGQPITLSTLVKAFRHELSTGNAKLKMLIGTRYVEKVAAGDMHSILFGMRAIWGIRDDDPASFALRVGGAPGERAPLKVEFVMPSRKHDEDDEPPPPRMLPAPPLPKRPEPPIIDQWPIGRTVASRSCRGSAAWRQWP